MQFSVFHIEGGIGKNIVATNVARNIKKTFPERELIVVSPYPEVFVHNPYVYRNYKVGNCPYFYEDFIKDKDTLVFKHNPYDSNDIIKREKNLAQSWCECFDLKLDEVKPEIYFNQIEKQNSQLLLQKVSNGKPIIAIQINGGMAVAPNTINFSWFRDLPPRYAIKLIEDFRKDFNFVQIRHSGQIQLEGTQQLDLSIREVMLFLTQIKGAVSIDSFVQHCMAAYNKSSLVCWIGNSPKVFGYGIHKNIKSNMKFNDANLESYLDPYPLVTHGHQCPVEYNPETLFDYEEIKLRFEELYCS